MCLIFLNIALLRKNAFWESLFSLFVSIIFQTRLLTLLSSIIFIYQLSKVIFKNKQKNISVGFSFLILISIILSGSFASLSPQLYKSF